MFRHVALSAFFLCLVIGYAQCGPMSWGDDGEHGDWGSEEDSKEDMKEGMETHMDMGKDIEMDHFVDFLWKAVKHGDLCEEDAWALLDHYKHLKHCGMKKEMKKGMHEEQDGHAMMKWESEEEEEEEHAPECEWMEEEQKPEWHAEMDMDMKHKKALKTLSKLLVKDGASDDYTKMEWKELLKHIMFSHENRQDSVIDMSQECTMKISAEFWAPSMEIDLCGLVYTLPEVHHEIHMEGDEIVAATGRHEPTVHITDLHGEPVHDGLYTMLWVDRGNTWETDGSFDLPYIHWMVTNIPGCEVTKGHTVKPYLPSYLTNDYQVFVYEQHDHIHEDFAIGDYTESDGCRYQHRCHFQQAAFVAAYHLQQRALGHFVIYPDPYSTYLDRVEGFSTAVGACVYYLDTIIPAAFEYYEVDTTDKMAIKKALKKFTSEYICKEQMEDEHNLYLLKAQFGSLVNKYIKNYTEDILLPNFVEFNYEIGLKYWAEADSVGLCGVWFDLPEVHRKVWLEEDKWLDGTRVELSSSEVRHAPMVKIVEREHLNNPLPSSAHVPMEDQLFTLLIVDRVDFGVTVATPERPYINWMIINVPGGHFDHGDEVVPYVAWGSSSDQYVFVYRQFYNITDVPMVQYTSTECRAENRCGFDQPRYVWDYDLQLVAAGRYDIKKDVYGYTYQMRRGNQTPAAACDAYLAAKKAEKAGGEKHHEEDM